MADAAGLGANKNFLKCIRSTCGPDDERDLDRLGEGTDETVSVSCTVTKVRDKDHKKQKRVLCVTNIAIYNFKPGKYKACMRRMRIADVGSIFISTDNLEEFVLHFDVDTEYDYTYLCDRREQVVAVIQRNYAALKADSENSVLATPELGQEEIELCRKTKKSMSLVKNRTSVVKSAGLNKTVSFHANASSRSLASPSGRSLRGSTDSSGGAAGGAGTAASARARRSGWRRWLRRSGRRRPATGGARR